MIYDHASANFFLIERWDPEAALKQKAQELLCSLSPG